MSHAESNPLEFRMELTRRFLIKIPDKTPKQGTIAHQRLETNVDVFLFFASSVIEIVKRQINDKFEVFDSENIFYIHGLKKNLNKSRIQKKASNIIGNYFTTPQYTKSRLDVSKSGLWRLQTLRNQAMHGNIIKISNGKLFFSYTTHGEKNHHFVQRAQNPRRYFVQIFCDLVEFVQKIQVLLKCANTKTRTRTK